MPSPLLPCPGSAGSLNTSASALICEKCEVIPRKNGKAELSPGAALRCDSTYIYGNGNNVALFQISFHPSCLQNTVKPAGPLSHLPRGSLRLQPTAACAESCRDESGWRRRSAVCPGHCVCLRSLQEGVLAGCPPLISPHLAREVFFPTLQKMCGSRPNKCDSELWELWLFPGQAAG